jgi:high-affinity K+ transport system ATPase subunit B
MGPGDLGIVIAFIGVLSGVGVLAGAFAGAYFFGKSKAQRETLRAGRDPEVMARLARVEQIVESTAIEIERISEGQRFTTRLLSEKKSFEP